MKRENEQGYITVYLTLTIAIMLSLIMTLIEGIRMQTIRFQTECVTDIGLNSIFAEYNRQVLDQYGLLFIDTSYGDSHAGEHKVKSHLLQYMNLNFSPAGIGAIPYYKDLTAIHADNVSFPHVAYASDNKGEVLRYQIVRYMESKKGITYIKQYLPDGEYATANENQASTHESNRNANKSVIDGIIETLNAERTEDEEPIGIENPADQVEGMRGYSILNQVMADGKPISPTRINGSAYISKRSYESGDGLFPDQSPPIGILKEQLIRAYLFDVCGRYNAPKQGATMQYQMEYLLNGKDSDYENLEDIANRILKIRYAINVAFLFSDGSKQMEAQEMALLVTSAIGHPQLTEVVKISILFAWAYAESVKDVRILFDGNKVARIKTSSTFQTPLSQLITFQAHLGEYSNVEGGMEYKDFLEMFLLLENKDIYTMRFMDIMEMDIRSTMGNQHFKMNQCIYQLEADINVSSGYGHGYEIIRQYSYE